MTQLEEIIAGLLLIQERGGSFHAAEHDEIWAGDVKNFSSDEISQMEEWGWTVSEFESFHRFV